MKVPTTIHLPALTLCILLSGEAFAREHILVNDTIGSIMGFQNLEYSYRTADKLTLGIVWTSATHVKSNGIELNGDSLGAVARYYFEPALARDSWYLSTVASRTNFEASVISNGTRYSGRSANTIAAGGGYHWFWDSFNLSLGVSVPSGSGITLRDAAGNVYKDKFKSRPGIELKMGGSF
jgi:hypothetical protein